MVLQPKYHQCTRIIDIDGTIIVKCDPERYTTGSEATVLGNSVEQVSNWFENGDYIMFWTARPEVYRSITMKMLDELGFKYHELLMNKPYCHNIHIYDDNPISTHKIDPKTGLSCLEIEHKEKLMKWFESLDSSSNNKED